MAFSFYGLLNTFWKNAFLTGERAEAARFMKQGWTHPLKDDFAAAIPEYDESIRADPRYAPGYINRAIAWTELKEREKARADLDAALTIEPRNAVARYLRGVILQDMGLYQQAIEDYSRALKPERNPLPVERADVFYRRGHCSIRIGDHQSGLDDADRVVQAKPSMASFVFRGWCRQATNDPEGAIEDYTEAIRLAPEDASLLVWRGGAYLKAARWGDALADFNQSHRMAPENCDLWAHEATYWTQHGQWARAFLCFETALKRDPEHVLSLNNFAWHLATCPVAEFRNGAKALELARSACDITKWDVGIYIGTLAAAHAEIGDFEEAVRLQTTAVKRYTESERRQWGRLLDLYRSGKPHRQEEDE